MVGYAAPKNSPKLFSVLRYRVQCHSAVNMAAFYNKGIPFFGENGFWIITGLFDPTIVGNTPYFFQGSRCVPRPWDFHQVRGGFICLPISFWERGLKLPSRGVVLEKKGVHLYRRTRQPWGPWSQVRQNNSCYMNKCILGAFLV